MRKRVIRKAGDSLQEYYISGGRYTEVSVERASPKKEPRPGSELLLLILSWCRTLHYCKTTPSPSSLSPRALVFFFNGITLVDVRYCVLKRCTRIPVPLKRHVFFVFR